MCLMSMLLLYEICLQPMEISPPNSYAPGLLHARTEVINVSIYVYADAINSSIIFSDKCINEVH